MRRFNLHEFWRTCQWKKKNLSTNKCGHPRAPGTGSTRASPFFVQNIACDVSIFVNSRELANKWRIYSVRTDLATPKLWHKFHEGLSLGTFPFFDLPFDIPIFVNSKGRVNKRKINLISADVATPKLQEQVAPWPHCRHFRPKQVVCHLNLREFERICHTWIRWIWSNSDVN